MKIEEIYELALHMGKEANWLGPHDYPDCSIIHASDQHLRHIFAGIDIGTAELLLVDRAREKGAAIDGVISHHPICKSAYRMPEVARIQQKAWVEMGVDAAAAKLYADQMIGEATIQAASENHARTRDAASMLNIPLLCIHTPADDLAQQFFSVFLKDKNAMALDHILASIKNIPEYVMAARDGVSPFKAAEPDALLGKFLVDMTGGLDPPLGIFDHLRKAGTDTIIGMDYSPSHLKAIKESGLSAVVCGHMATDSIGLNIFCDRLEAQGVQITSGAGFYRHKRR